MKHAFIPVALVCVISLFAIAFLLGGMWMESEFHGHHTPYCPKSHQKGELRSCYVLDQTGSRVLIQHVELDSSRGYLEIWTKNKSVFYAMPESIVQYAPQGYRAHLLDETTNVIEIDGKEMRLAEIASPTF